MKNVVLRYFQKLFSCKNRRWRVVLGLKFKSLSPKNVELLEELFLIEELKEDGKSSETDVVDLGGSFIVERLANMKRKGPVCGENMFVAGIFAVKMTIENFKPTGWENKVSLVRFLDCKILLNWIENPLQRPWGLAK
ncbi:hypothetical protein V6N13_140017 [Hibiscus sabdariffa]